MNLIYILVILILLGTVGFLLKLYFDTNKQLKNIQDKEQELDYKLSKINSMKIKIENNLKNKIAQADADIKKERQKFDDEITARHKVLEIEVRTTREDLQNEINFAHEQLKQLKIQTDNEVKEKRAEIDSALEKAQQELTTLHHASYSFQRMINGYGDEYLIPQIQLIDELAENYHLEHAGNKLKACRTQMREMIKSGNAVIGHNERYCKILLDYFITKSEDLLSKVKHENYGKLKQELADILAQTQYYAQQAKWLAEISQPFYDLTQEQLKWASVIHAMKIAEREEQRELREQMREEERARKEYERAMRDAAKEESMLQAAMSKAQIAMEKANAEQKAQYEAQLAELNIKLQEAQEKNQRALSMAQQTKAGHVYLISNIGSFGDNMMKIGMTRRLEPLDRVRELGDASVPFQFDVHAIIYSDDAPRLENELHRHFNNQRVNKVNYRKEFFRVSVQEVKEKLDEMGIQAHFTLAAQALEYRETLRIESMNNNERDKLLDNLLEQENVHNFN